MDERLQYGLNIEEADQIPERVDGGLLAFCICVHGTGRSPDAAWHYNKRNVKSFYLISGLEGLARLSENELRKFYDYATYVPNLVFLIDEDEEPVYGYLLDHKILVRKNGTVLKDSEFNRVFDQHLKRYVDNLNI